MWFDGDDQLNGKGRPAVGQVLLWWSVLVALFSAGCAVNPVTGDRELALISESREIELGRENYPVGRQMQGGDYRVEPALNAYVSRIGGKLAGVSDRRLPYEFTVVNNSTPNAWALPGGKIAIHRGLLVELDSEAELAAVLSHEIVHAAARHSAGNMERGLLLQGAVMVAGIASRQQDYSEFVVGGARLAAMLLNQKYSRDAEREADYYGMRYMARAGYDPRAAVDLQETFIRLSDSGSRHWLNGLFSSHPPSAERLAANRETLKELPAGGIRGRDAYHRRVSTLMASRSAYEQYDEGRRRLTEGDYEKALRLVERAIEVEPREAHFYTLRGDVRLAQERYEAALADYNRSLLLDPDFFYYYLQRGKTSLALGRHREARRDFRRSLDLLPTASALNLMGEISLGEGERKKAKEYFRAAAEAAGPDGREAGKNFIRLDLADNPGQYLQVRPELDRQGYLLVRLTNRAPLAVEDVLVEVAYPDNRGRLRRLRIRLPEVIGAGVTVSRRTGVGPLLFSSGAEAVSAGVLSVRVVD